MAIRDNLTHESTLEFEKTLTGMNFRQKLRALTDNGYAFMHFTQVRKPSSVNKGQYMYQTLVPYGTFQGRWITNRTSVSYSPLEWKWMQATTERNYLNRKLGKRITAKIPFPTYLATHGADSWTTCKSEVGKLLINVWRKNWPNLAQHAINIGSMAMVPEAGTAPWAWVHMILCWFGDEGKAWLESDHNQILLRNCGPVLQALPARRRHIFLRRLIRLGAKKAFRLTFTKLHPRTRNEVVRYCATTTDGVYDFDLMWKHMKDIQVYIPFSPTYYVHYRHRPNGWLRGEYERGDVAWTDEQVAQYIRRHGWETFHQLTVAYQEYNRHNFHGWPGLDAHPNTIRRWHDNVNELRQQRYEEMANRSHEDYEKARKETHRKKAILHEKFTTMPGVTLLTTREEYHAEGQKMHHCVGGYWNMNCIILHVELNGEVATAEVRFNGHLAQLRGVCNERISAYTHKQVKDLIQSNYGIWFDVDADLAF